MLCILCSGPCLPTSDGKPAPRSGPSDAFVALGTLLVNVTVNVEGNNASAAAAQTPDAQAASGHAFWLLAGMLRLDSLCSS